MRFSLEPFPDSYGEHCAETVMPGCLYGQMCPEHLTQWSNFGRTATAMLV